MRGPIQQKKASIGIIVGFMAEGEQPAALLQVRAPHDTYPGACQVTAHGKLTGEELALDQNSAFPGALGRKLREEVGEVAAQMIAAADSRPIELERVVNESGRLVVTQGVALKIRSSEFQELIVPGKDVGGFRVCTDPSEIQPLEQHHKASGVPPNETRMFRDELQAVVRFFKDLLR